MNDVETKLSQEVVKQFETILNPPYLKSLLDYLINNKEPVYFI